MTDERWPRVKALFQSAAARPSGERDAFLAAATGDDEALRREVESLLTAIQLDAESFVARWALGIALGIAGRFEEAIAFARRAWDEREPPFILWARHFPPYRTLRSDPRFAAILREMDEPV